MVHVVVCFLCFAPFLHVSISFSFLPLFPFSLIYFFVSLSHALPTPNTCTTFTEHVVLSIQRFLRYGPWPEGALKQRNPYHQDEAKNSSLAKAQISQKDFSLKEAISSNPKDTESENHFVFESPSTESYPSPGSDARNKSMAWSPETFLLEHQKGEAHPHCLLLITISLTAVTDEVNSLSSLRQHFPKESKFCFAIAPPPHPKPCLDSQPGPAHSDHLACSCDVQVETLWHERPMVPFTSCKWHCLGCRLPHPFHWKGKNCHFLLCSGPTCVRHMAGDCLAQTVSLTGCISSTLWMQLFGRTLETEFERLELWNLSKCMFIWLREPAGWVLTVVSTPDNNLSLPFFFDLARTWFRITIVNIYRVLIMSLALC